MNRNGMAPLGGRRPLTGAPKTLTVHLGPRVYTSALLLALLLDYRFNPEAEGLSYTIAEILAWALLLYQLFSQGPDRLYERLILPTVRRNPMLVLWTVWAALASLASWIVWGRVEALAFLKQMMPGFITFMFIIYAARTTADWVRLERAFLIGLLALGLLGSSQHLFGGPYLVEVGEIAFIKLSLDGNYVRDAATGLSQHPNNFGMIVAPALAFAIVQLIHRPFERPRPLVVSAVLAGGVALYGTAMKGAFFWLAVGIVAALIPRRLLHPAVIILGVFGIGYLLIDYSLGLRTDLAATVYGRTLLWQTALDHMAQPTNWLAGTDIQQVAADNLDEAGWEFPSSHMVYLNNAIYFGWPAAAFYIGALSWGFISPVRVAKISGGLATPARGVIAALVTISGIGILESISDPNRFGIIYVSLGFAAAMGAIADAKAMGKPDARRYYAT